MVVSIYLRGEVGGEQIRLWDGQGTDVLCSLTTSWQRFSLTTTYSNTSVNCLIYAASGTPTIYAWGAQTEGGSVPTTYQRVTTSTNYDSVGFPRYLRLDGVDDFMATSAFDFGSDKASVFTGITKNMVSSNAFWVDFGNRTANSFELGSLNPTTPRPYLGMRASGSIYSAFDNAGSFDGNVFSVHSGLFDVAGATLGDSFKRRVNGVQRTVIQNDAGPVGTGNFGTQVLRLGHASGLHNGAISQIVILNRTATADEITKTENFIANKSGVTI
jgi:hypothetical protein